ncbi:unnamed protein product [Hapterophycus canaliculatus]
MCLLAGPPMVQQVSVALDLIRAFSAVWKEQDDLGSAVSCRLPGRRDLGSASLPKRKASASLGIVVLGLSFACETRALAIIWTIIGDAYVRVDHDPADYTVPDVDETSTCKSCSRPESTG